MFLSVFFIFILCFLFLLCAFLFLMCAFFTSLSDIGISKGDEKHASNGEVQRGGHSD